MQPCAHHRVTHATLLALALLAPAAGAQASKPREYLSEIITPAGWELNDSSDRCAWRDLPVSAELVVPRDWGRGRSGDTPTWGGCVCSDLVIPAEWRRELAR
jgi:hypothetical protein